MNKFPNFISNFGLKNNLIIYILKSQQNTIRPNFNITHLLISFPHYKFFIFAVHKHQVVVFYCKPQHLTIPSKIWLIALQNNFIYLSPIQFLVFNIINNQVLQDFLWLCNQLYYQISLIIDSVVLKLYVPYLLLKFFSGFGDLLSSECLFSIFVYNRWDVLLEIVLFLHKDGFVVVSIF